MAHCVRCKGEITHMTKTETASFNGGSLSVLDIPLRKCECETVMNLSDGVLVDGYKLLLERNGIIGKVEVTLGELKKRYPRPMELLIPHE
jgi:hypothetical protein